MLHLQTQQRCVAQPTHLIQHARCSARPVDYRNTRFHIITALRDPEPLFTPAEGPPARQSAGSLLHTVNSVTKWGVTAAVTTTVLARRDSVACWGVVGSVAVAAVCKACGLRKCLAL